MTFARKKCGNVSLNSLFLILSAPVESSWEKDLGFPKDQEEPEGRDAALQSQTPEDEGH